MKKLTEQNIIDMLECPETWDVPSIFEEIHQARCLDSNHYKTIRGDDSIAIISEFTYEWREEAGTKVHSERLYCYDTYKVRDDEELSPMGVDEMFDACEEEYEDLETFIIENYPLISTEYYI